MGLNKGTIAATFLLLFVTACSVFENPTGDPSSIRTPSNQTGVVNPGQTNVSGGNGGGTPAPTPAPGFQGGGATPTPAATATPSATPTPAATATPSATPTPVATATPSATPTPAATATPSIPANPAGLLWSNPATWPSNQVPTTGQNVMIPTGQTVILDVPTASLGDLHIHGILVAATDRDASLTARSIHVMGGTLRIGTEAQPFTFNADITLTGAPEATTVRTQDNGLNDQGGMSRALHVMNNGVVELHGQVPSVLQTRLRAHGLQGAVTIEVTDATQWRAGDTVAISLTDFYSTGSTFITTLAQNATGNTLTLSQGLPTFRWGLPQYPLNVPVSGSAISLTPGIFTPASNETMTVIREEAFVVNLSRRIRVQGANDQHWTNSGYGCHTMVMGRDSEFKVSGVQFRRCGQERVMGRYPVHNHIRSFNAQGTFIGAVDGTKNYLKKSAIWQSMNRGVTIHGTWGFVMEDTAMVDVVSHGLFLEDGSEEDNIIRRNIAMQMRVPAQGRHIKNHDNTPTGYWITNPKNYITHNVASGFAIGFWISLADQVFGQSANARDPQGNAIIPNRRPLGSFDDNIGHSNSQFGLMLEHAVWNEAGDITPQYYFSEGETFFRNQAWKNEFGGYFNRARRPTYVGYGMFDNKNSYFSGSVQDGIIRGALLVGQTLNNANAIPDDQQIGIRSYHFEVDVVDLTAINFFSCTPRINFPFAQGCAVFDHGDLYLGNGLGHRRNSNWRIINSDPGWVNPAPQFDMFAQSYVRNWSNTGAIWDYNGIWGPAQNYLVANHPYFTHAIAPQNLTPVAGGYQVTVSTPHRFFTVGMVHHNNNVDGFSSIRLRRLQSQGQQVPMPSSIVGEHPIPRNTAGSSASPTVGFLPNMRGHTIANGGHYMMDFMGEANPSTAFTMQFANARGPGNRFLMAIPWSGLTVNGRHYAGEVGGPSGSAFVRNFQHTSSLAALAADTTGSLIYHDIANQHVWVHINGDVPASPLEASVCSVAATVLSDSCIEKMQSLELWQ